MCCSASRSFFSHVLSSIISAIQPHLRNLTYVDNTISKRDQLSKIATRTGLVRLLEFCPRPNTVLAFNYHRVGNHEATTYHDLFSADENMFAAQVEIIKRKTSVLCLNEVLELLLRGKPFKGTVTLVTFDDGYLDNYRTAFPILRSAGVPGLFFLATSFVGSSQPPWWDEIAFIVRHCKFDVLNLDYPAPQSLPLGAGRRDTAIRELINLYQRCPDGPRLLADLRDRSEVQFDLKRAERLFLDWNEAREMIAGGMDIGAHTHSHCNLGRLSLDDQIDELRTCREQLEGRLNRCIDVLADPYGNPDSFNRDTFVALERLGYRAAFSYYGGINRPGAVNKYNLARCGIDHAETLARFRLRLATSPLLNGYWF